MNDDFGDRMKAYEADATAARFSGERPVYARIDGRSFSRFTRKMARPFDAAMSGLMREVTAYLVEHTNARCGYTQSDEISLVFQAVPKAGKATQEIFFNGSRFKMTSQLAALATVRFMAGATELWPEHARNSLPTFDARVFELPDREEAANCFLWRTLDCERNAVSTATRAHYSPTEMTGQSVPDMLEMLAAKHIFMDDFDPHSVHGSFVRRVRTFKPLPAEKLARIPEAHRPTGPIERLETREDVVPAFRAVRNRADFLFEGATALYGNDMTPRPAGYTSC